MPTERNAETSSQPILRRFESYGFWGGLGLGLLVGVLASGPNFHDWAVGTSVLVISVCAIVGAVIGFLAYPIATGSGGPGLGSSGGDSGGGAGGDGGSGGGDCA